jgi:formyltetrahydrofolate deformylase
MGDEHILTLSCRDQKGLVAAVANCLFVNGANILEAQQFDDVMADRFFMRVRFELPSDRETPVLLRAFEPIAKRHAMDWKIAQAAYRKRVLILVSKFDHCLVDLAYRCRIGELNMDIVAIISNHPQENYQKLWFDSMPFHHIPNINGKKNQEEIIFGLFEKLNADLIVLARYMQILSSDFVSSVRGRCINIHHSFLPGFKGAKPYHQAYARGVKMIGATAHYVTEDLDEGPIIAQDVEPISHTDLPDDLVRKGRDIERRVLARAVQYHLEDRVLLNGSRTVVFAG